MKVKKAVILVFLFVTVVVLESSLSGIRFAKDEQSINNSHEREQDLHLSDDTIQKKDFSYNNVILNNSISFSLDQNSYSKELELYFTNVSETRDFINNGDFNCSSTQWDAQNETDINYKWTNAGPNGTKCVNVNVSALQSKTYYKPINAPLGIETFQSINNWELKNNDTDNFAQNKDPDNTYPQMDGTGSTRHEYNASLANGIANSSYQFYFQRKYPIYTARLSFWYRFDTENAGPPLQNDNQVILGAIITTPSQKAFLIDNWEQNLNRFSPLQTFENKVFSNISRYFNETGFYNLTFYSKHIHTNSLYETTVNFDYIDLNITCRVKEFNNTKALSWNQTINFAREVSKNPTLNFSCFVSEKFSRFNSSEIFLSAWINEHQLNISAIKTIVDNRWINYSANVEKEFISNKNLVDIKLGMYFNTSTYILPNETFFIFFDNISFIISDKPHPRQINLKIFVPELISYYLVDRTMDNQDYVLITSTTYIWQGGQTYYLDISYNSSVVVVNITLSSLYHLENAEEEEENEDSDDSEEYAEVSFILMFLVLLVILATVTMVSRVQKRFFLNEKYEYVKKLKIKRKDFDKKDRGKTGVRKKRCIGCGRMINATAKFCEHCGKTQ